METDETTVRRVAERVAKRMKIRRLERMPGMDEVAIALNARPTYDEEREAEAWVRAVLVEL